MDRIRYLTVPKNEMGIEEYNQGIENTENLVETTLGEPEFLELVRSGVFKEFNDKYNLLIDDFESESISAEELKRSLWIIKEKPGAFLIAAQKAIEYNTFLALDF